MIDRLAHVTIQFDPAADPIGGELTDVDGQTSRFDGWLDLLSSIERSRAACSSQRARDDSDLRPDDRPPSHSG